MLPHTSERPRGRAWLAVLLAVLLAGTWAAAWRLRSPGLEIPETPPGQPRIAVLGPNLTEILFELGLGPQVVGVSDYNLFPPEAQRRPRIGGLLNPNLERLVLLRPDVLLVSGHSEQAVGYCVERGVDLQELNIDSLDELWRGMAALGERFGHAREARSLIDRVKLELSAVSELAAGRPRPRTLLVIGRSGTGLEAVFATGGGSFLDELLGLAGGQNVFADEPQLYFQASKEAIITAAPEVILELAADAPPALDELRAAWSALPLLPAVRNGRLRVVAGGELLLPGPRVATIARRLAEALHGQEAPDRP